MTKRFSVRIEDRTVDLVITESTTAEILLRVPLTIDDAEKLETYITIAKQVLTGSLKKEGGHGVA